VEVLCETKTFAKTRNGDLIIFTIIRESRMLIVLMIGAILNMMVVGCNTTSDSPQGLVDNGVQSDDVVETALPNVALPTGRGVEVTGAVLEEEALAISLSYPVSGPDQVNRVLRMDREMMGSELYTAAGELLIGQRTLRFTEDSSAIVTSLWTTTDSMVVTHTVDGLSKTYEIGVNTYTIEFESLDQANHAQFLMRNFDEGTILDLPQEDQDLFNMGQGLGGFLGTHAAFLNSDDAVVVSSLIGDFDFVFWVSAQPGVQPNYWWFEKLCDIASVVSMITCLCFAAVVCAAACVMASPLAGACAVMSFFDII